MPNAKNPTLLQLWHHHGGICGNLASRLLPSVKQQLQVRGAVGWQLQRKISFSLLSSFLGSLQQQPKLFLWSPPSAEDHDVLVPPSDYPVKATSHNKPTTSHKAAGHAHTFTIEVARDTALCSEIAFVLMFIDCPFQAADIYFCSSDMGWQVFILFTRSEQSCMNPL